MRNKDYRELQISSSSLVFIFLSIIVLGIIIFLLGVSVGKKQTRLTADASLQGEAAIEKVVEEKPALVEPSKDPIREEIASHKQARDQAESVPSRTEAESTAPPPEAKTNPKAAASESNRFYIQAGAYQSREGAEEHAAQLRQLGFPTQVHDPPSGSRRQLYRVRVGGYATRGEAESMLQKVAAAEKKSPGDYFITQI